MPQDKATILGVNINSSSAEELLNIVVDYACKDVIAKPSVIEAEAISGNDNIVVFTPNPEFLVEASRDRNFRDLLNKADINLPDGIGLVWASRLLGCPISQRVSGADVAEGLLKIGNRKWEMRNEGEKCEVGREVGSGDGNEKRVRWVIGIAGARRGVLEEAEELIKRLREKYPNITFINLDSHSENSEYSEDQRNRTIRSSDSLIYPNNRHSELYPSFLNIVFACHGMKKQENWIWENKNKYNANVFMGVGGSLDFLGGFSKRAPKIMRVVGLEWLWRGLQKPSHFKRIWKATFLFGWMVIKEKFKLKTQNSNVKTKT